MSSSNNNNNNNNNMNNNNNNDNKKKPAAGPSQTNLGGGGASRGVGRGAGRGSVQRGRGGSTAHRGRGGSIQGGQSANRAIPTMDSPPPTNQMKSLSLTAQSSTSPSASATSPTRASASVSPTSRPSLGDLSVPPIDWPVVDEEDREEQHKLFLTYYKNLGFEYSEEQRMFLPRAHNYWAAYNGETYLSSRPVQRGALGDDEYEENFLTYAAPAAALPELEKKREKNLADAKARLAQAQTAPDSPNKANEIRGIEKEVRLLENPLEQYVPPFITPDMERLNPRKCEGPNDIAGNNSVNDTMYKFGHIAKRMSAVGAFGTEEVPGPDGKLVKKNREWVKGAIWRPSSYTKHSVDGEEPETPTFHGFIPRHPRPHGLGLGHLGYDSIYSKSRDGVWYTADDVPCEIWEQSVNAPLRFVSEDGEKLTIDRKLSDDNPILEKIETPKPLSEILAQNKARNSGKAPHQGRSQTRGRGSGARGGLGWN